MPTAPTKGELFEARVARLLHAEGAFVRRRVDLNARFHERFQVTDIDVLAVSFDRTLQARVVNGECKTTEAKSAPSSADRLLWLVGVAKLIDADSSLLATTKGASDNTRALAARLGSELVDPRDLQRREELVGLTEASPYGSHAPELAGLETDVSRTVRGDEELRRVFAFVRSELWLSPPVAALKRAVAACRLLGGRYSERLPTPLGTAVTWLADETIIGIVLALTRLAGLAYRQPEDVFERFLHERLAEGAASFAAMREMSKAFDKYLLGVLTSSGVNPARAAGAIGGFDPRPPAYAEPLVELIQRLALSARATADLARLAEYYLLAALDPRVRAAPVPAENEFETARLLRLVASFLKYQAQVPDPLLDPLRRNGRDGASVSEPPAAKHPDSTTAGAIGDPALGSDGPRPSDRNPPAT